jgi:hypothetical protein
MFIIPGYSTLCQRQSFGHSLNFQRSLTFHSLAVYCSLARIYWLWHQDSSYFWWPRS